MNDATEFCFNCNHCRACAGYRQAYPCSGHEFRHCPEAQCYVCSGPNELAKLRAENERLNEYLDCYGLTDEYRRWCAR